MEISHSATYNVLHNVVEETGSEFQVEGMVPNAVQDITPFQHENSDDYDDDDYDSIHDTHGNSKHAEEKKQVLESFDFNDVESMMWRKVINFLLTLFNLL